MLYLSSIQGNEWCTQRGRASSEVRARAGTLSMPCMLMCAIYSLSIPVKPLQGYFHNHLISCDHLQTNLLRGVNVENNVHCAGIKKKQKPFDPRPNEYWRISSDEDCTDHGLLLQAPRTSPTFKCKLLRSAPSAVDSRLENQTRPEIVTSPHPIHTLFVFIPKGPPPWAMETAFLPTVA